MKNNLLNKIIKILLIWLCIILLYDLNIFIFKIILNDYSIEQKQTEWIVYESFWDNYFNYSDDVLIYIGKRFLATTIVVFIYWWWLYITYAI